MSKCNFSITFSGPAEDVLLKAKTAIERQGGIFQGDLTSGTFNVQVMGSISGSYTISGQSMIIDIDSKPVFIPCGQLESFMQNQFSS